MMRGFLTVGARYFSLDGARENLAVENMHPDSRNRQNVDHARGCAEVFLHSITSSAPTKATHTFMRMACTGSHTSSMVCYALSDYLLKK